MRGKIVMAVVVTIVLSGLTGCRVARAGARCNTRDWGRDSTHVMQCRRGRWVRVMTIQRAAQLIGQLAKVNQPPPPPVPPLLPPPDQPSPTTPTTTVPGPSIESFEVFYALTADQTAEPTMVSAIRHELEVVSDWFATQTSGRRPRFVRSGGQIAVTTLQLPRTRAQLEAAPSALHQIEQDLAAAGRLAEDRTAIVYVDSGGDACGVTSDAIALFMAECTIYPSTTSSFPFGGTYLAVHEMTHAFGAVRGCAPHYIGGGHVGDDPRDVLYAGPGDRDWDNLMLDPGHDDYFAPGAFGCYDIASSPLWES